MLAFAKDITQTKPRHPEENKNSELKEYMDYQRKLDHERLIYHSLDHAKNILQENLQEAMGDQEKLKPCLQQSFPLSKEFADADTLMLMLRKLVNGQNSTNNWYRMNAYYYALVYDSMKQFIKFYNRLLREAPEKAEDYKISEGMEIDFDDWVSLYFSDLDFHIGKDLGYTHYPFAKRNAAIQEEVEKEIKNGKSREQALQAVKEHFEIDDISIKVLLDKKIDQKDLELFYTSVENPIYEYLNPGQEGRWGSMDGESLLDHAYYMGSNLKIWEWRKREQAESVMDELLKTQNK
ncbi:MAG: hypothetical protein IID17_15055 [Nitrospinae bacterium]|nr:hypothetical protein [Nitrospinota bacterium]